jgi:SAM-dependent methyltransferase
VKTRPPGKRKALTNVGGEVARRGDDEDARILEHSLAVRADEDAVRAHVHGFHSYTARMHPLTARRLVEGLSAPGDAVLDPFCGSGTVLVEARLAGRRGTGIDANPLAVALATTKTRRYPTRDLERLVHEAARISDEADARRKARAGATRNYGTVDRELFDPHVLFELDGLRAGIERLPRSPVRDALWLALSSLLVKVSRKPGDSAEGVAPRRLASGFTVRMFRRRAEELASQLDEFARLARPSSPPGDARLGDARVLEGVRDSSIALIATSPPYPGVYDYHEQHEARLRWLGFDGSGFEASEIGSRRELNPLGASALRRWRDDFGQALAATRRVLVPHGAAVLLIADSAIGATPIYADEVGDELAAQAGLYLAAVASQERPHFHGPTANAFRRRPRCEHALLFRRVDVAPLRRVRA